MAAMASLWLDFVSYILDATLVSDKAYFLVSRAHLRPMWIVDGGLCIVGWVKRRRRSIPASKM